MSQQPKQPEGIGLGAGCGIAMIVGMFLVILFVALITPSQKEKAERREGKEKILARLCTDERRETAMLVISEIGQREMFVDQTMWAALPRDSRFGIAHWASSCTQDGFRVTIRSAQTGQRIGKYTQAGGYDDG